MTETKFQTAERLRNAALEYIKANPGCPLYKIHWHLEQIDCDVTQARTSQLVGRMENLCEVRRTGGGVGLNGRACGKFYALADRTVTSEETIDYLTGNLKGDGTGRAIRIPLRRVRKMPELRAFGGL